MMKVRIDRIFHIVIGLCAFREVQVHAEAAVTVHISILCEVRSQAKGTARNNAMNTTQRNYTGRIGQIRPKRRFLYLIQTLFAATNELMLKNGLKNRTVIHHSITT